MEMAEEEDDVDGPSQHNSGEKEIYFLFDD